MQDAAAVPRLNAVALEQWLESYDVDLTGGRSAYVLQKLDWNKDQQVDVPEYVRHRLTNSGELLCHTAAEAAAASYAYAFPGCPCNPRQGAAIAKCPIGALYSLAWYGSWKNSIRFSPQTGRTLPKVIMI
jgi:hypothetical protein